MNFMRDRLVEKLKKHGEKVLSQIIEQQSRFVASVIYNTSKGSLTKEDIEEVTADVFVTLWNNAEKVQEGKLKGYLCGIAKINEGGERRTDDRGVFHETTHLQYFATKEMAWNLGSNRIIIDLDKVQSVIINGDTLYQK